MSHSPPTGTAGRTGPFRFRVNQGAADDLAALIDNRAMTVEGALSEGLTLLLGLWVDLGTEGYYRLEPAPEQGPRTLGAWPTSAATDADESDPEDQADLPVDVRMLLRYLASRIDATEQDLARHALRVARVLHDHADRGGSVQRVGGIIR